MRQIHIVIRRINPAVKVDLVQIGYFKDGQFSPLPLDALAHTPLSYYIVASNISDSPYIDHSHIPSLIESLISHPDFSVEFFDNTLVLMFSTNLSHDEVASKEEGKGN